MKIKFLASAAILAVLASACQKTETASTPGIGDRAQADSLTYLFGQMSALDYLREGQKDTTLLEKQAKDEYARGLRAGLQAVKADKKSYNQGFMTGIQMALSLNQFKEEYGISLSDRVLIQSFTETLNSDENIDGNELQQRFYRILSDFNAAKDLRDEEAAKTNMKVEAEKLKMVQLSEDLYSENPKTVKENPFKEGDNVILNLTITRPDGTEVNSPFQPEVTLGSRMRDNPLMEAILTMAPGESGKFLTTAKALFGQRAAQLNLKPSDVLILSIKPELIKNEDAE